MTQKEILEILKELKTTIEEYNPIRYESSARKKELYEKISELYGSVQTSYIKITGNKNIEVPGAGSQIKSTYNNYFEAGYLSGRTFHSHQGFTELLNVIGQIKNNKDILKDQIKGKPFTRNEWIAIIPIILVLLGGSFLFGKYIGENRFDNEKIILFDNNKELRIENNSLKDSLKTNSDSLITLNKQLSKYRSELEKNQASLNSLKNVNISYYKPKSIFDGTVFISANEFRKELEFKGIKGLDDNLEGDFNNKKIELNKGDRFFIKLENNEIWVANLIDLISGVDLELYEK